MPGPPPAAPHPEPTPHGQPPPARLSLALTLVLAGAAVVVVADPGCLGVPAPETPVAFEEIAVRVIERDLMRFEPPHETPLWDRLLVPGLLSSLHGPTSRPAALDAAARRYEALLDITLDDDDPEAPSLGWDWEADIALRLAVVLGEAERWEEAEAALAGRVDGAPAEVALAELVRAAYGPDTPGVRARLDPGAVAHLLDPGWTRDRLLATLYRRQGLEEERRRVEARLASEGAARRAETRVLGALELGILLAGLGALLVWRRRAGPVAPPRATWASRDGWGVVCAEWAGGVLLLWGAYELLAGVAPGVPWHGQSLFRLVIAAALVHWLLLAPHGRRLVDLVHPRGATLGAGPIAMAAVIALAAGLVASDLLHLVEGLLYEDEAWLGEVEAWLDRAAAASTALLVLDDVDAIVFAPIAEELIFRGVLFLTLRRHLTFWPAALLSGAVFAVIHFYPLVATLQVLVFGVALAWALERTGSLIPPILAHAGFNAVVVIGELTPP